MIDLDNHNYIISIEYISSKDETILPMLLVSRVNILHNWYQYNDLDNGNIISTIEFGYANNNIILELPQHFIHYSKNKREGI